jgi:release factor glutamine methyltransferase
MKLQKAIQDAYYNLKSRNIKSALLDSELLMAKVLNESREHIILNMNKDISKNDYNNFQHMVNQRSEGKPIAYLVKKKFFLEI